MYSSICFNVRSHRATPNVSFGCGTMAVGRDRDSTTWFACNTGGREQQMPLMDLCKDGCSITWFACNTGSREQQVEQQMPRVETYKDGCSTTWFA